MKSRRSWLPIAACVLAGCNHPRRVEIAEQDAQPPLPVVIFVGSTNESTRASGLLADRKRGYDYFLEDMPVGVLPTNRSLEVIALPASQLLADGSRYTVFIDRYAREYWVLREGGYAGVREVRGPARLSAEFAAPGDPEAQAIPWPKDR